MSTCEIWRVHTAAYQSAQIRSYVHNKMLLIWILIIVSQSSHILSFNLAIGRWKHAIARLVNTPDPLKPYVTLG